MAEGAAGGNADPVQVHDDGLPPSPQLSRGRSAIGVQNNAALVIEQVGLALKREPLEEQKGDMANVPIGALVLAQQIWGDAEPPPQMLSMIRAASMDLAKSADEGANERKAFEAADPHNIPEAPGPPPPPPAPLVPLFPLFKPVPPPPSAPALAPASSPPGPPPSAPPPSSPTRPTAEECPLCGGKNGDAPEPELKIEVVAAEPSSSSSSSSSSAPSSSSPPPGPFSRDPKSASAPVATPEPSGPVKVLPLNCSHCICNYCFHRQLATGWTGARISFGYLNCPLCAKEFASDWEPIQPTLAPHRALREKVHALALAKFNEEGQSLLTEMIEKGKLPKSFTPEQKQACALLTMAMYKCVDCLEPFCGGRVSCAEEMDVDARNMRCHSCVWSRLARETDHRCMQHGFKFAIFKCDSCCAVATWDCGWNHFCERCHGQAHNVKNYPCPGPEKCPLGMPHPKNLAANFGLSSDKNFIIPFVIGCMACVGYTQENPGCSRPSPKEMEWEVKRGPEEENKNRAEDTPQKEPSPPPDGPPRKASPPKKGRAARGVRDPVVAPPKPQGGAKCAEGRCKCVGFKAQKWQPNKCHACYHWQNSHS